jgi:hypothetical protein
VEQLDSHPNPVTGAAEETYERWRKLALDNGFTHFLSAEDGFHRMNGSNRLWSGKRPGIYLWLAADGEVYVGQSVVPRLRLRQHIKAHGDLVHAAFQPCAKAGLNALEQKLVDVLGKHFPLRNIKFALSTASSVPFDELVSPAEQQAFLAGEHLPDQEWQALGEHERRQSKKFERFTGDHSCIEPLACARLFVSRVIPKPATTEACFWSASLFPDRRFIRINAGQQEVFTVEWSTGRVRIFSDRSLSLLRSWRTDYQTPSWVNLVRPAHLESWLAGDRLLSCRCLVLRLMRHTQALNSASHCPQLLRDCAPFD